MGPTTTTDLLRRRVLTLRRIARLLRLRLPQFRGSLPGGMDHGHTRSSITATVDLASHGRHYVRYGPELQYSSRQPGTFRSACNFDLWVLSRIFTRHGVSLLNILNSFVSEVPRTDIHAI